MPQEWLDFLSAGGVVGCLVLFIFGLRMRWWVMGDTFVDMKADRDFWRDQAVGNLETAKSGAKTAEVATDLAETVKVAIDKALAEHHPDTERKHR